MANQAIALQARAPQTDFLGRAIQQNAQMINMMSQQRAAERQAAAQQQAMEIARAEDARAAAKAGLESRKANQEYIASRVAYFTGQLPSVTDDAGWNNWLNRVAREDGEYAGELRRMSGGRYDQGFVKRVMADAKAFIEYTTAKPEVEVQVEPGTNILQEVRTGGLEGVAPRGAFELPAYELGPNAGATPSAGAPATDAQIDEAARAIVGGAGIQDGPLRGLSPQDFDRATERANQITAGGGRMQPISMTTGVQMGGQPDMTAVVQDMMASKQISQSNLQLMREMAGPDKDQQLAQILKANNIQIVPDAQPGMRSAVFRPGEDAAPQMQMAQAMEGYRPTGRAARGKPPMQSPMPGSAIVPIERVRQEAAAGRETPREAAAKAAAVARANAEAAAEAKRAEKLPGRKNVSTIIGKMRSAYEQLNKMEAIPSAARGGGANFLDYLAVTRGGREVQKMFGTAPSKYLSQIETLRKQLATAIKNATGMSAQEMNSNVELQLTLDSLSDPTQGIEAALQTMRDLEELYGLPAPAKKPAPKGAAKGGVDMNNPLLRGM